MDCDVMDLFRLEIEVQRGSIEIIVVGGSVPIRDERVEELAEPVFVVVVGYGCHKDDGIGVGLLGHGVAHTQQLNKILDRAPPAHIW